MINLNFRIWNKARKSYSNEHKHELNGDNDIVEYFDSPACCFLQSLSDCLKDDNIVIEQSTGFNDRNGKEVFIGDICKYIPPTYSIMRPANDCIICYGSFSSYLFLDSKKGNFSWILNNDFCKESLEVIGNINENPELI